MSVVGIVLAAGASRRFGSDDKLLAPFRGKPLAAHAAAAMGRARVDTRVAVVASDGVAALFTGFGICRLRATAQQSDSLKAGLAHAVLLGADRIVVTLADMPFVTPDDIAAVAAGPAVSAATDDTRAMPPAAFAFSAFPSIRALSGDRGAGPLIGNLPPDALTRLPASHLRDIDTPEALDALDAC